MIDHSWVKNIAASRRSTPPAAFHSGSCGRAERRVQRSVLAAFFFFFAAFIGVDFFAADGGAAFFFFAGAARLALRAAGANFRLNVFGATAR